MDKITFSYNWNNKLQCQAFTTVRLESSKYTVDTVFEIWMKGVQLSNAQIMAVKSFLLKDVSETVALIDTGYNKEEFTNIVKKMYPRVDFNTKKLMLITLKFLPK